MSIQDYLAQGGVLTSPENAPARYRAELLRIMASFVDSELAGAAGFADVINLGPGVKERIAAARIVLEKTGHGGMVLELMGEFGADISRYAAHHPWTDRLERDAPVGAERHAPDMRLSVFNYPLTDWADAVTMSLLMGRAATVQLEEYASISYQPLAEAFRGITPREQRHADLAEQGLANLIEAGQSDDAIAASLAYWWPRVSAGFGAAHSARFDALRSMGLRKRDNPTLRADWEMAATAALDRLGLEAPL